MRFYTYVSDAKVDMLMGQIDDGQLKKLAHEFALDLGVLKLSHKQERNPERNRFGKLEAVLRHIQANEWCASLDHEAPYISDTLFLNWGRLRRVATRYKGDERLIEDESQSPVLFGLSNYHECDLDLLMTGSANHVIGAAPTGTMSYDLSASSVGGFAWYMENRYPQQDSTDEETTALAFRGRPEPRGASHTEERPGPIPGTTSQSLSASVAGRLVSSRLPRWQIRTASQLLGGVLSKKVERSPWMRRLADLRDEIDCLPVQKVEFLAKRISRFSGAYVSRSRNIFEVRRPIVLASPIYVALAE
jgi:hypothetical protein